MLYILLALVSSYIISLYATLIRLKVMHKEVYTQLDGDDLLFRNYFNIKVFAQLVEFFIKKKHIELKDPILTCAGCCFIGSFVAFVVFFIAFAILDH